LNRLLLFLETAHSKVIPSLYSGAYLVSLLPRIQNPRSSHRLLRVGRAASRVHVTQPGYSHLLHNQRRLLDTRNRRTVVFGLFLTPVSAHSLWLDQDVAVLFGRADRLADYEPLLERS